MDNLPIAETRPAFTPLRNCLCCGSHILTSFLDLGTQPLANAFHAPGAEVPRFSLHVNVCQRCWHSQLSLAVDPALMFSDYPYVSGTSASLGRYFDWFVEKVEEGAAGKKLKVLEIGSNDGSLLAKMAGRGHLVTGVDPAANLAQAAGEKGVPTIALPWADEAFKLACAADKFDIIIAMNVLAHVAEPAEFLFLCAAALAPGGRIYIQTSQSQWLQNGEFDCVYHEHVSYFTERSLRTLAAGVGLSVERVETVDVHGGSLLATLVQGKDPAASWVQDGGFTTLHGAMQPKAEGLRRALRRCLDSHDDAGYTNLVAYGAAAKGMTLLNFCGVTPDFIIDDNPLKQGKLAPLAAEVWVKGAEALNVAGKTIFLILAWNMYDEIAAKIRAARPGGGDVFVRCFPRLVVEYST